MSTNSKIVLVLNDKDFNTKHTKDDIDNDFPEITIPEKRYMSVYCHWDGYPEGVGKTLFNEYETYEKIFSLLLGGSLSSLVCGPAYYFPREEWYGVCPEFSDTCPECNSRIEYVYKFENGIWYVKNSEYVNNCRVFNDWKELKTILANCEKK